MAIKKLSDMSLRDHFAGQLAPWFIDHIYPPGEDEHWTGPPDCNRPHIAAQLAYELADFTLIERAKKAESSV